MILIVLIAVIFWILPLLILMKWQQIDFFPQYSTCFWQIVCTFFSDCVLLFPVNCLSYWRTIWYITVYSYSFSLLDLNLNYYHSTHINCSPTCNYNVCQNIKSYSSFLIFIWLLSMIVLTHTWFDRLDRICAYQMSCDWCKDCTITSIRGTIYAWTCIYGDIRSWYMVLFQHTSIDPHRLYLTLHLATKLCLWYYLK